MGNLGVLEGEGGGTWLVKVSIRGVVGVKGVRGVFEGLGHLACQCVDTTQRILIQVQDLEEGGGVQGGSRVC